MNFVVKKNSRSNGMPSASGMEWKAWDVKDAKRKFNENYEKIFPERKPWYERRDSGKQD